MSKFESGFDLLPAPIVEHMRRCVHDRPRLAHVYHVTELLYCLRKAFYRRKFPETDERDVSGILNIYRGQTFDGAWSRLFEDNQETYILQRDGVSIVGTFDFIHVDEKGERALYDLKMPSSVFYKKRYGAGEIYKKQVQAYLAMAHANGEFLDVHKGYVLMIAEDVVREEVAEDPSILEELRRRAFWLDRALTEDTSQNLVGPEEKWECDSKYCAFHKKCRKENKNG